MLFRRKADILYPIAQPLTTANGVAGSTYTFRIKQENRRLDGIVLRANFTAAGTTTYNTWSGPAGLIKEIRIRATDRLGNRNIVQVSGSGIISWTKNQMHGLDRFTQAAYGSAGFAVSQVFNCYYHVPIRQPLIEDPWGNALSLPLSATHLGDDVIVEVDTNDSIAGIVFGTLGVTWGTVGMALQPLLREVPDSAPYIPSELKTDIFAPSSTASPAYDFGSLGYLTSFLVQGFSANPLALATTRASLLSTGGQFRVEYGRELIMRTDEGFQQSLADLSSDAYPDNSNAISTAATCQLQNRNLAGESMFDFISDLPAAGAFSANSIYNLSTNALGGDKMRLVFNDFAAVGRAAHITQHRFLAGSEKEMAQLSAGV